MKKRIMMMVFAMLLIGSNLYAAGDLTVDGNLTVKGDIIADKKIQSASIPLTANAWIRVYYPIPFSTVPAVVATGAKPAGGGSTNFFVVLRDVQPTYFEFKAQNHDNTGHAVNAGCTVSYTVPCDVVHWLAMVP